jgi:hypothetical protein
MSAVDAGVDWATTVGLIGSLSAAGVTHDRCAKALPVNTDQPSDKGDRCGHARRRIDRVIGIDTHRDTLAAVAWTSSVSRSIIGTSAQTGTALLRTSCAPPAW